MRKSFTVATAFTGAAACAAAFMPGGTAAAATASKARPDSGSIFHIDCPAGSTTSLHLYRPASADHGPTCVGLHGSSMGFDRTKFKSFCAGNNNGYIYSTNVLGISYGTSMPGDHEWGNINKNVSAVYNNYWTGKAKCPYDGRT